MRFARWCCTMWMNNSRISGPRESLTNARRRFTATSAIGDRERPSGRSRGGMGNCGHPDRDFRDDTRISDCDLRCINHTNEYEDGSGSVRRLALITPACLGSPRPSFVKPSDISMTIRVVSTGLRWPSRLTAKNMGDRGLRSGVHRRPILPD
jgi:hypothetical protein